MACKDACISFIHEVTRNHTKKSFRVLRGCMKWRAPLPRWFSSWSLGTRGTRDPLRESFTVRPSRSPTSLLTGLLQAVLTRMECTHMMKASCTFSILMQEGDMRSEIVAVLRRVSHIGISWKSGSNQRHLDRSEHFPTWAPTLHPGPSLLPYTRAASKTIGRGET